MEQMIIITLFVIMDEGLSREEKRKLKKKERKKKQRQSVAAQKVQMIENTIDSEINNDDNESEEVKVNITNSTVKSKDKQLIPKAICEKCKQSKVKYFCQECNLYYCENVHFSCSL